MYDEFNPFQKTHDNAQEIKKSSSDKTIGIVSAVRNDPVNGPQARVTLPDCDGKVSAWLPVTQTNTVGTASYHLPRLKERVWVEKPSNGREDGIITGSIFCSSVSTPPVSDPNNHSTTYDDGSVIDMDPSQGTYSMSITKAIGVAAGTTITILADDTISISGEKDLVVTIGGNVTLTVKGSVNATVSGDMTANVTGNFSVTAASNTLNGPTTINGDMNLNGTITHSGSMNTSGVHTDSNGVHV